jgi:hypothetical protein
VHTRMRTHQSGTFGREGNNGNQSCPLLCLELYVQLS